VRAKARTDGNSRLGARKRGSGPDAGSAAFVPPFAAVSDAEPFPGSEAAALRFAAAACASSSRFRACALAPPPPACRLQAQDDHEVRRGTDLHETRKHWKVCCWMACGRLRVQQRVSRMGLCAAAARLSIGSTGLSRACGKRLVNTYRGQSQTGCCCAACRSYQRPARGRHGNARTEVQCKCKSRKNAAAEVRHTRLWRRESEAAASPAARRRRCWWREMTAPAARPRSGISVRTTGPPARARRDVTFETDFACHSASSAVGAGCAAKANVAAALGLGAAVATCPRAGTLKQDIAPAGVSYAVPTEAATPPSLGCSNDRDGTGQSPVHADVLILTHGSCAHEGRCQRQRPKP